MSLPELKTQLIKASGRREYLLKNKESTEKAIARDVILLQAREKAQALIQSVAQKTQTQLKLTIEDIVQSAIDAVFSPECKFRVDYEKKRNGTDATMYLEQDGDKLDPLKDDGGGLADVLAFALRLVAWSLGKTDNVMILDEPFKNISKEYKGAAMEMLKGMGDRMGIQSIIVTHDQSIIDMADKVFHVEKGGDGVAIVRSL